MLHTPHYLGKNDHKLKIRTIPANSLYFQNSFFPKVIHDWNELPEDIVCSESINSFLTNLRKLKANKTTF